MISNACRAHLKQVNETGLQHMFHSYKTAFLLLICIPMLLIHGIAPRFFTNTTTNILKRILAGRSK